MGALYGHMNRPRASSVLCRRGVAVVGDRGEADTDRLVGLFLDAVRYSFLVGG